MSENKFENLINFVGEYLEMRNLRQLPFYSSQWQKENKIDIEQWNGHDYQNLIAFKSFDAWIEFCYAMENLINFHHRMYRSREIFKCFFKSYNLNEMEEFKKDVYSNWVLEKYFDFANELLKKGYILFYMTTQRECHDRNQFLMYMLDNWKYAQQTEGHMWNFNEENEEIEFICLNEK